MLSADESAALIWAAIPDDTKAKPVLLFGEPVGDDPVGPGHDDGRRVVSIGSVRTHRPRTADTSRCYSQPIDGDVAIVGSGFGGIAAGVKLRKAGIERFTIYERALGIGGDWWDNTLSGMRGGHPVDPLLLLVRAPRTSPARTCGRPSCGSTSKSAVDQFGLRAHLRCGVGVDAAMWEDTTHTYRSDLDDGTTARYRVLISAVGFLNVPKMPDWPGLATFRGSGFSTRLGGSTTTTSRGGPSRWSGRGRAPCSSFPRSPRWRGRYCCFQREPGWVIAKGERDLTADERAQRRDPLQWRWDRLRQLWVIEKSLWRAGAYRPGSKVNAKGERACRRYIDATFADRPDLRDARHAELSLSGQAGRSSPPRSTPPCCGRTSR